MNKNFYQRAMQRLQAQNQDRYSHLGGNGNGGMGSGSDELAGPRAIFGLIATSTTNVAADAILFGYGTQGDAASAGSATGVAITGVGALSHGEYKRLTAGTPYELLELRLRGNAAATIPATITVRYRKTGGSETVSIEVFPRVAQGSTTQDGTRAEVDFTGVIIDSSFQLTASIAANGTLDFYFIARKVIDVSRGLQGKGALISSNAPAPSVGPPQRLIIESAAGVRNGLVR